MDYNEQLVTLKSDLLECVGHEQVDTVMKKFAVVLELKYGIGGLAFEYNLLNNKRDENSLLTPLIDIVDKAIAD